MICVPGCTICEIDYSAAYETVCLQDVVHDAVICVCIYADDMASMLSDVLECPV